MPSLGAVDGVLSVLFSIPQPRDPNVSNSEAYIRIVLLKTKVRNMCIPITIIKSQRIVLCLQQATSRFIWSGI